MLICPSSSSGVVERKNEFVVQKNISRVECHFQNIGFDLPLSIKPLQLSMLSVTVSGAPNFVRRESVECLECYAKRGSRQARGVELRVSEKAIRQEKVGVSHFVIATPSTMSTPVSKQRVPLDAAANEKNIE